MPVLNTTNHDLSDDLNMTQARHELHRALDYGGDAEQAKWTRDWAEAALDHAEGRTPDWDEYGPAPHVTHALERAREEAGTLKRLLKKEPTVTEAMQARMTLLEGYLRDLDDSMRQGEDY